MTNKEQQIHRQRGNLLAKDFHTIPPQIFLHFPFFHYFTTCLFFIEGTQRLCENKYSVDCIDCTTMFESNSKEPVFVAMALSY